MQCVSHPWQMGVQGAAGLGADKDQLREVLRKAGQRGRKWDMPLLKVRKEERRAGF